MEIILAKRFFYKWNKN